MVVYALINCSHNQMLLAKRLGCDFAFVVDGVSFDVHSGFLATGSEVLEEYAFPADVSSGLAQMNGTSTHGN